MKRHFRYLVMLAGAALMGLAHSCMVDAGEDDPAQPIEPTQSVTFRITVPAGHSASRALAESDEYAVAEVAVLAFDAGVFIDRYPGTITAGPTHTMGAAAVMTFEAILPTGSYDLMVVANAADILDANAAALTPGMPQAAVESALTMSITADGWITDPSDPDYRPMPMWGYRKAVAIPSPSTVGTIFLTRMVAKVDVQLGADAIADNNFRLSSVRIYNYAEQGRLIPETGGAFDWTAVNQSNLDDYDVPTLPTGFTKADPDTEWIERTAASPWQALTNEIYLFEAPQGIEQSAGDGYFSNTCLVVGGSFSPDGGATWGADTYYRIDFTRETEPETFVLVPLLRGNAYTVSIDEVESEGYPTPREALENYPDNNIAVRILDWAAVGITVVSDGVWMLGVTPGTFEFSYAARTATSADNALNIVTNHPDGWTATVWADENGTVPLSGNWLRLSQGNGTGNYPAGDDLHLLLDANSSDLPRTAYIHIRAGTLNYIITVTQNPMPPVSERMARSNIVWDGTKLTFAETVDDNDRIPADAQGLFFLWGSLVAISPMALPGGNEVYSANRYPYGNILYDPTDNYNYPWESIPYTDEIEPPFDDMDLGADDFATYNGGVGYNAATGKGDICRYISAQGWVEGNWRLPTVDEWKALIDEKTSIPYGDWSTLPPAPDGNNDSYGSKPYGYGYFQWAGQMFGQNAAESGDSTSKPLTGVFITTSGSRLEGYLAQAGNIGYYWAASSCDYDIGGAFYIYPDAGHTGTAHNYSRSLEAMSVRCIRE